MINNRIDKIDLRWAQSGDLVLLNGDLQDTSKTFGQGFLQEVMTRVNYALGSWKTNPSIGSTLDEFEGQPNNEDTGKRLESSVQSCLTRDGFLSPSDFEVAAVPVGPSQILLRLAFLGILTDQPVDSRIILNIIYDLTGKGPYLVK